MTWSFCVQLFEVADILMELLWGRWHCLNFLNSLHNAYLPNNLFLSGHTRKSSLSPSFPWTPVGTWISLRWPGISPDIRNIYLFGKYRDFTYRKDNNPNGQLQSTFEVSN
jgi:hypothetical protein